VAGPASNAQDFAWVRGEPPGRALRRSSKALGPAGVDIRQRARVARQRCHTSGRSRRHCDPGHFGTVKRSRPRWMRCGAWTSGSLVRLRRRVRRDADVM
jgi:hypothetical protein